MAAACDSFLMATDVADALVAADVPFREAHEQAGTLVRRCLERGVPLDGLCAEEVEGRWLHLAGLLHDLVDAKRSLAAKVSVGGSAPKRVREELALARERLA
jgi:argininosuccinate lyase